MLIMKNLLLTATIAISLSFSSLAQDMGKKAVELITSCTCREIVMISRGVEKSYTSAWLEGVSLEENFIVFSKGETYHRWNSEKITFIEQGNGYYRIYLD